ncbi:GNAT family N-acetyltransferase [Lysobacter sp. A3-1-A15]|uniref:GNAT family N-acetyltransferase n=1 Tax=Novilysobacter viscosus TaxID=3098602 RepID=UPI002ED9C508
MKAPEVRTVVGPAIEPLLDDLARLRMAVLREWPYLYAGDFRYEFDYLQTYLRSPFSLVVLALDEGRVVGASPGMPLADESPELLAPFADSPVQPADVFYLGESVLLPEYRGRGLGHRFFEQREAHARALGGYAWTGFTAVQRDPADPRCPPFQRSHEAFWKKRGYQPRSGLTLSMRWPEPGRGDVEHALAFWTRPLERF